MRYMRLNAGTETPHNLLFVDCETRPVEERENGTILIHKLRLGAACHTIYDRSIASRQNWYVFRNADQFLDVLLKCVDAKRPLWIFSHNAGFDMTIAGLWELAENQDILIESAITSNPPTIVRFRYEGMTCIWVDTLNWVKCSLEELGEMIGLHKFAMPPMNAHDDEWLKYCTRDVEIILHFMVSLLNFHKSNDLGVFKMTIGSQALQTFRHRFCPIMEVRREIKRSEGSNEIKYEKVCSIEPHDVAIVKALERDAYHQGHSWVFKLGRFTCSSDWMKDKRFWNRLCQDAPWPGPVYQLDVNSLYPMVMYNSHFPSRLLGYTLWPTVQDIKEKAANNLVIANVLIDNNKRMNWVRLGKRVVMGTGRYWTSLCGLELECALLEGCVHDCSIMAWYEGEYLFKDYVEYFYKARLLARESRQPLFDLICKSMMNSLYGKFAQKQGRWIDVLNERPDVRWEIYTKVNRETGETEVFRGIGDLLQIQGREDDMPWTFTAIPAFVTSYARAYMAYVIGLIGEMDMFYTNVDSIHCGMYGLRRLEKENLIHDSDIGKFRIVTQSATGCHYGIRDYELDGIETIAGVSKHAEKLENNRYRCLDFEELNHVIDRKPDSTIVVRKIDKTLTRGYPVGQVLPDGTTLPYRIKENDTQPLIDSTSRPEQVTDDYAE